MSLLSQIEAADRALLSQLEDELATGMPVPFNHRSPIYMRDIQMERRRILLEAFPDRRGRHDQLCEAHDGDQGQRGTGRHRGREEAR